MVSYAWADIHKIICIRGRTPLLAGAALPAYICWGPAEDLASEAERDTNEMSGDSRLQYNSYTEIAKPWPSFWGQQWNSCLAQQGLPLSCDSRMGLCISALAGAVGCWAIPVLVLDSCRDRGPARLAWEMIDATWLAPRDHNLSLAFFKQGPCLLKMSMNCSNFGLRFDFMRKISIALGLTNITPSGKQLVCLSPLWYTLDQQQEGISWKDDVDCSHLTAPLKKTQFLCISVKRS